MATLHSDGQLRTDRYGDTETAAEDRQVWRHRDGQLRTDRYGDTEKGRQKPAL